MRNTVFICCLVTVCVTIVLDQCDSITLAHTYARTHSFPWGRYCLGVFYTIGCSTAVQPCSSMHNGLRPIYCAVLSVLPTSGPYDPHLVLLHLCGEFRSRMGSTL
jgi:hypothetical protein